MMGVHFSATSEYVHLTTQRTQSEQARFVIERSTYFLHLNSVLAQHIVSLLLKRDQSKYSFHRLIGLVDRPLLFC